MKSSAAYAPLRDEAARILSGAKVPISWPSIPVILPHRFRRKLRSTRSRIRSRVSPTSSISALQYSFSPSDTLRALRLHRWSFYDGQYLLMAIIGIFSLGVIQSPGPMIKTLVATLLLTSLILPITRQFFLPFLPIATWLVFFYSCQFISSEYRPPIWVKVLPALENIFYGANLSNILSAHKTTFLDILAWLPYGITHFGAPFVCSAIMFVFGPPGTVPSFARTFGYMNLIGVMIQLLFPCSPPWYENLYGLAPANYSMPGSPAGLAAIDKLFGIDLYTSSFTASPVVFGAFPSLHSGCATTEVLFMSHVFPRLRPLFAVYLLWLWWATMYLSHHYAVDLVGGALIAGVCFYVAKAKFLPRLQVGKMFRWDYEYVEIGEKRTEFEGYGVYSEYALADDLDDEDFGAAGGSRRHNSTTTTGSSTAAAGSSSSDTEEWTLGSSSGYSSGTRSPSSTRSPVEYEENWESETLASPTTAEKMA